MPNNIYYTELVIDGVKEYAVTLLAGEWTKYRRFNCADDANRCVEHLKHIRRNSPLAAMEQFTRYGLKGTYRVSLSSVVEQGTKIVHHTKCPDGTVSIWIATLQGEYLECTEAWVFEAKRLVPVDMSSNTYSSLNAFIRSHYNKVRPNRKGGNGWNECKANVNGKWVKLSELRYTVASV